MEQQQRLKMMESGVAELGDIRTLVRWWKKVLAELGREDEGPSMVWKTHRQVGIEVEDRRPGRKSSSLSWPPQAVVDQFLAHLKAQGLEMSQEPLIPGYVLIFWLKPRNLH